MADERYIEEDPELDQGSEATEEDLSLIHISEPTRPL